MQTSWAPTERCSSASAPDISASVERRAEGRGSESMLKIALITGAGTGIGRAVSLALAREGYAVVVAGRRRELLQQTASDAAASGASTLVVPTDIGDTEAVHALFTRTKETFGRLDLLFNNAGIAARAVPIEELTIDEWRAVVDVNLT